MGTAAAPTRSFLPQCDERARVLEAGRGEIPLPNDPVQRAEAIDRLARTPLRKRDM